MNEREAYFIAFTRARAAYDCYGDSRDLIISEVVQRIGEDKTNLAEKVYGQISRGQMLPDGITPEMMRVALSFLEGFRRVN